MAEQSDVREINEPNQWRASLERYRSNEAIPLWLRRPQEIQQAVDDAYESIDHTTPPSSVVYQHRGESMLGQAGIQGYGFGSGGVIDTGRILNSLVKQREKKPRLLDVGAGGGGLLRAMEEVADVHGITAHDFRTSANPLTGIDYTIANAENLRQANIFPQNSFDTIQSEVTMRHLVDPLGTLVQMYDLLKEGGIVAIDLFSPTGLAKEFPAVVDELNRKGYQIAGDYGFVLEGEKIVAQEVHALLIRKTQAQLLMPIAYNGLSTGRKAQYRLTRDLPLTNFVLPEGLIAVRQKLASLYPSDQVRQVYEHHLITRDIQTGTSEWLRSAQFEWEQAIRIAESKGEGSDRLRMMNEVTPLLTKGILQWREEYENRFKRDIQDKLHLPVR